MARWWRSWCDSVRIGIVLVHAHTSVMVVVLLSQLLLKVRLRDLA